PLIIGSKGSPLELTLNTLYFESDVPAPMRYREVERILTSGLARAIPLYTRFRAQKHPIIGTTVEYFEYRRARIATGRMMALVGECVLGANAARDLGAGPRDTIVSSPENVFDIAGVYPLRMKVVGILAPGYTPDDEVIFVDIKTAWIIEGLGHGHEDLARPEASGGVLRREGNNTIANASVVQYNEIDASNLDSFHFHGRTGEFPVTACIVVPRDEKSAALLQGRYVSDDEFVHVVEPVSVMKELLATIFTVQSYVVAAILVIGLSTLATMLLVFMLSFRLRRREILTMMRIGGSQRTIFAVLAGEIITVLVAGVALAGVLTLLTSRYGSDIIRAVILS
ncbi:MAG: hypothetical protein IH969_09220, partial [Candidatus Krumholzibacteriota bacterium]|nr:hypothetical protein [Candidatus Krumholzibacteriota bacterium]